MVLIISSHSDCIRLRNCMGAYMDKRLTSLCKSHKTAERRQVTGLN